MQLIILQQLKPSDVSLDDIATQANLSSLNQHTSDLQVL